MENGMENTLPESQIEKLGLTIEQFKNIGKFPNTIDEFRKHPLQMVSVKSLVRGELNLEGRKVLIKKGTSLVIPIIDFMKIYNASKGTVLTGTSILKDNFKLYNGENLNNKKILVWMFGCGWGDLLFAQAIMRNIKKRYSTCKITMAAPKIYHSFINSFKCVDSLISTPFDTKYIKNNNYHIHFDALVNHFSQGKTTNCYELMAKFINMSIPKNKTNPKIPVSSSSLKYVKKELIKNDIDEFIVLHLKTSSPRRNPSNVFKSRMLNNLLKLGYKVVFVDSADQKKEINKLIKDKCNTCFNFCGITRNMNDVAALLSMAKIVVSVDTSIIHIATAVGVPTYGLYGPFPGEIRLSTYKNSKWYNGFCPISPCMEHTQEICNYTENGRHPSCYDTMDMDRVIKEIKTIL